ncbi:MAG: N-acetylmuramoyl-L-alanine amidase [Prevotella sp.]|jgi:N-acetylmuramoyl-L-alanine amidase|nr:N-acetylmuramoyl-L-alanine amidase [Prevotella sp.]
MRKILGLTFCLFVFCSILNASGSKFVVVIDAGHGGKDGGAVRGIYKEKEINLGVALALGQLIERNYKDVKVVYTRKTDVFIALDTRAEIANKAKANLFISIHTNSTSAKTTNASGADTYILGLARSEENLEVAKRENSVILLEDDYTTKYEGFDPRSPESYIIFEFMTNTFMEQSLQLANLIQNDFKTVAKRPDRGVRQAGFLVLRKTSMPSILIELGFINNQSEASFLSTKSGQQTMASAIYSGFKKYKREFDKKQGKFVVADKEDDFSFDTKDSAAVENINTKEPVSNITQESKKADLTGKIEYRVQFLISRKKLPDNSPSFRGLSPVTFYKDEGGYKYTYGSTTSLKEIMDIQHQVNTKFKDAFIVKFKDGKRVK